MLVFRPLTRMSDTKVLTVNWSNIIISYKQDCPALVKSFCHSSRFVLRDSYEKRLHSSRQRTSGRSLRVTPLQVCQRWETLFVGCVVIWTHQQIAVIYDRMHLHSIFCSTGIFGMIIMHTSFLFS